MATHTSSPPILRFCQGNCQRCGRESALLAKVAFSQNGRWGGEAFDQAVLTCAHCRLKSPGAWRLAKDWNGGYEPNEASKQDGVDWEAWKAANEPLTDPDLLRD